MNAAYSQTNPMALSDKTTKALLVGGALAGPLFTTAWIVGGALTANYDPLRHPISSLVLGEFGWMQVASFLISGPLVLGFAIGLRRLFRPSGSVWGPLLVGLAGIGLIGAGIFPTDPANGYPPNSPIIPIELTTHGILHNLFAVPVLLGLPIACLVFARLFARIGARKWAIYSVVSGATSFVMFFLSKLGLDPLALVGQRQRIGVTADFIWLTLLALYMLQTLKARSTSAQSFAT